MGWNVTGGCRAGRASSAVRIRARGDAWKRCIWSTPDFSIWTRECNLYVGLNLKWAWLAGTWLGEGAFISVPGCTQLGAKGLAAAESAG